MTAALCSPCDGSKAETNFLVCTVSCVITMTMGPLVTTWHHWFEVIILIPEKRELEIAVLQNTWERNGNHWHLFHQEICLPLKAAHFTSAKFQHTHTHTLYTQAHTHTICTRSGNVHAISLSLYHKHNVSNVGLCIFFLLVKSAHTPSCACHTIWLVELFSNHAIPLSLHDAFQCLFDLTSLSNKMLVRIPVFGRETHFRKAFPSLVEQTVLLHFALCKVWQLTVGIHLLCGGRILSET